MSPYALVVISAITHAYWNFLLKKAQGTQIFIGLSKLAEVVLFLPPFLYFVARDGAGFLHYWIYYLIGAALVILNYVFLGQAYKHGDLSLIYPTARGGALLFLPILAWLWMRETIDAVGLVSIILIVAGLAAMQVKAFTWRPAMAYALLAAFTTACYTLWDKRSLSVLSPFIYFYAYTAITGIAYGLFILVKYPASRVQTEWKRHKFPILQVGFFNAFTYLLVLFALQSGKASYVIALRQLSIAFGVIIAWKVLRESFSRSKQIGIALLLAGCLLISLAR